MRAALYLRISDDREGRELGVTRQREDCATLAARIGATVAHTFEDNDLGASTRSRKPRPQYQAMLREARAGGLDVIIAYTSGRLTRRPREHEDLIELAERHGVTFAYVASPSFDLNTSAGRRVARILAANDAGEAEDISERTGREARQRAQRGAPNGGPKAFGYDVTGMALQLCEEPDECDALAAGKAECDGCEAQALSRAYAALLARRTLSGIAADLNAAGWRTSRGGGWKHNAVRLLLANPRNAGLRAHRGELVGNAQWPAIVSEDTWRAAVSVLGQPARRTNHVGSARKWLGTRRYRCGRCAPEVSLMVSTYRSAGMRIYRCPSCGLSRGAQQVDAFVGAVVRARLRRADLAGLLTAPPGGGGTALRTEAAALRQRRKAALRMFTAGDLTEVEFKSMRDDLAERLADAEARLTSAGRADGLSALMAAEDPVAAWDATGEQVDRRGAILDALMTVGLLPSPPGVRLFDPRTVAIEWRSAGRG